MRRPVTVAVRTIDTAMADRLPGLAAEIAFWVVLSLPALLVSAVAAASLIGTVNGEDWQTELIDRILEVASVALTPDAIRVARPYLDAFVSEAGGGLVFSAVVVAIWVSSRAVKVVLTTVAIVYGREGRRAPWLDRLLGFGVTIAGLVVMTVVAPLLIAGPAFGEQLDSWVDLDLSLVADLWSTFYWPVVVLVATGVLATLYHLGVPGRSRWFGDLPGAILATSLWLLGSAGLRLYGAIIAETGSVYGPLAGPIVGLLWLWVTGLAVLLGAQLNAQIELTRSDPDAALHDEPEGPARPPDQVDETATVTPTPSRDERRARRS